MSDLLQSKNNPAEKDYLITMTVKNNRLLQMMKKRGLNTIRQLSDASGTSYATLCKVANLKITVYNARFEMRPVYQKLCSYFGCTPEDVISENHFYEALKENKKQIEVDAFEMEMLTSTPQDPHLLLENKKAAEAINEALGFLTPREKKVIERRFGLNGRSEETLQEVAMDCGVWGKQVTSARIREIEMRALRKLTHPARCKKIKEFMYS